MAFAMEDLYRTDEIREQIELGKKILKLRTDRYTETTVDFVKNIIKKIVPGASAAEQEDIFFRHIYDFWVYGNNIQEEFYFDFLNKTDAEKREYITLMEHVLYCTHLNRQEDSHLLMNKYETYSVLGREYYKRDMIIIRGEEDFDEFCAFVDKHSEFVVKPSDLWQARGVYKEECKAGTDRHELFMTLLAKGQHYNATIHGSTQSSVVLEEVIDQGEELARLHPASVNLMRVPTVRVNGQIHIHRPYIKIGIGGNFVTAGFNNSPTAGVNVNTGKIETPGNAEDFKTYYTHPDTGIELIGFQIPDWEGLKEFAKKAADKFPTLNIIGWDMAWTKDGWSVLEGNEKPEFGWQRCYAEGNRREFEELLGWKPEKEFWWM